MKIYCEDCEIKLPSYGQWLDHLPTPGHQDQIQVKSRIVEWVREEQHGSALVFISLFVQKDPLDILTKFTSLGLLWNFYIHPDRKFFIVQFDTKQVADRACSYLAQENTWKLQVRKLTELDTEDWCGILPTLDFSKTSHKMKPEFSTCGSGKQDTVPSASTSQHLRILESQVKYEVEEEEPQPCIIQEPEPLQELKINKTWGLRVIKHPPSSPEAANEAISPIQAKLRAYEIDFVPVYQEVLRCCVFEVGEKFRTKLESHMQDHTPKRLNSLICQLWSTFALDFILSKWNKCYRMEANERIIYEELWNDNNEDRENLFPTERGYEMYCSVIDCVGYLTPYVGLRWNMKRPDKKIQPSPPEVDVPPATEVLENPFDKELAITDDTNRSNFEKRRNGSKSRRQATWKFQCNVMYETQDKNENDLREPRIVFLLTGDKQQKTILLYVVSALRKMFHPYMMYLLTLWLESNQLSQF